MDWKLVAMGAGAAIAAFFVGRKIRAATVPAPACQVIPAYLHGGTRPLSNIKWIVLHSTESDSTAEAIGNYFASPSAGGSTQVVVGPDGCVRSLEDDIIPAAAPGANNEGVHIEFVGFARWTREEWLQRAATIENGRRIVRDWARKYGIPKVMLGPDDLKAGKSGITTHAAVSAAFHLSDHTDPGPGFPTDLVIS